MTLRLLDLKIKAIFDKNYGFERFTNRINDVFAGSSQMVKKQSVIKIESILKDSVIGILNKKGLRWDKVDKRSYDEILEDYYELSTKKKRDQLIINLLDLKVGLELRYDKN